MTDLGEIFAELGISHYLHDFIEQGFDTWDTILDIKESDFDALGVKLGHRRKLQRRIANSRGLSSDRALESPGHPGTDDRHIDEQKGGVRPDTKDGGSSGSGQKRKYRRHPKTDENAPDRPPSAYVIFSNKMREDLKGRNLSFTEIAKLVGEHWQNLLPAEKEPYEQQAFTAKERYNAELAEYKKTDNYRQYSQYLADFKAKQSNQQQPTNDPEGSKRPKLEAHPSTASTATTSSGASASNIDTPGSSHAAPLPIQAHWQAGDGPPPSSLTISTKHAPGMGTPKGHPSPSTVASAALPGYRESIYGGSQQALPWRDGPREQGAASLQHFSRMASVDRQPSHPSSIDSRNSTGSAQHSHRTGNSSVPPLLSSESTNMSTGSSNSTSSSVFFTPRTPMEPPYERSMALPSLFSQNSTGSFDNQLPPIRPPSLSPRTTIHGPQQSPTVVHPNIDFQPPIAPLRGYGPAPHHSPQVDGRSRDQVIISNNDDNLDPVEKLLRASEVLDQNSRKHP